MPEDFRRPTKRWLSILLVFFGLLAGGLLPLAAADLGTAENPVIVGFNRDYPPYELVNPHGAPDGYSLDLIRAVARVMGLKVRFEGGVWGDLREDLIAGRIHVIPSVVKSDARARLMDFSDAHHVVHYSIFMRIGGDDTTHSLEDLRGKKILVGRGSQMHEHLVSQGLADAAVPVTSEPESLRQLAAGKGDAALAPHLQGLLLIKQAGLDNLHAVGAPVWNRELGFAVAKGHEDLRDRLNTGLAILHRTGEYRQIHLKWFGEAEPPQRSAKELLAILAVVVLPLALVLAGVLIWNRTLRQRVAERTRDLRQSKDFLQTVQDALPLMVFAKDPKRDFQITVWNRVTEEVTGIPAQEALGRTDFDLFPSAQAENFRRADREALTKGGLVDVPEETLQSRNCGERVLRALKVPVLDEKGQALCILGIAEDITERKRMEDALRQTQRLESLGVLAGGIAHDFNNLLTAILGNLEITKELLDLEHPVLAYLTRSETAALRAATLARQMLAYSGRGTFLIHQVSLNALILEMSNLLQVSIPKKVVAQFELDETLPFVSGDEGQLQQVVMNLVTNAAEAIGDHEGTITLSTRQETLQPEDIQKRFPGQGLKPGPFVVFQVTDTGCGMGPDVMQRLFEPFFTTKFTGRGLGLSALHGILRGHEGGIQVESELGKGSVFRVYLPAQVQVESSDTPRSDEPLPSLGGTILLVEDDAQIRQATHQGLVMLGYQVLEAVDGLEAMEILRGQAERISLVLLDLTMPKKDGREVLKEMQQVCPEIPVVLCSGYHEREALNGCETQSVAGFLSKPYQIREVAAMLEKALRPTSGASSGNV